MITSIRLQHFRSYADESFEFDEAVNIVVGPNASGKTNLLEAVLVLAAGRSYRARDLELIEFGKGWTRVEGFFGKQNRVLKLKREDQKAAKSFEINAKACRRLSLERTEPVVFFEPNHLQLLSRGPEQRRDYIDDLLERSQPGFKNLANSYRRALAQRNTLLKHGHRAGQNQLFVWNIRLSELGGKLAEARQKLIDNIDKSISKTYSQIAHHKSSVKLVYEVQFPIERYASRLLSKLEASTKIDYERGFTASGPHREDVLFYLNKRPAAGSASRGESRSLLLALKIYELGLIEKARGERPVFLLDDVFSELDSARRRALVDYLKDHQLIITTTDADAVIEYFSGRHNLIPLT